MTASDQALPMVSRKDGARAGGDPSTVRLAAGAASFCLLMAIFWFIARAFHLRQLEDHPASTFASFALLFAPYWMFGFDAAPCIRRLLPGAAARIAASSLITLPYFVLSIPRGEFHWQLAVVLIAIATMVSAALEIWQTPATWVDLVVLAVVGLTIDLGWLNTAGPLAVRGTTLWPPGLGGFPKMMMANVALYGYLVIKPIDGIGYSLVPRLSDFKIGLREMLFYTPIVIPVGLVLGFLHFHRELPRAWMPPAAWIFTFIFVALPEELFFRGLVQNLLERRIGRYAALALASILFGLSHFNKGATFNWRYVLLAAIAGIFYGRAWLSQRRLFASSVTHASVDTIWSLWFR